MRCVLHVLSGVSVFCFSCFLVGFRFRSHAVDEAARPDSVFSTHVKYFLY